MAGLKTTTNDPAEIAPVRKDGKSVDVTPVKAAAEAIRELHAGRMASAEAPHRVDAGLVLMPETAEWYDDAKGILAGISGQSEEKATQKSVAESKTKVFFAKCRYNHPPKNGRVSPQHGVYFTHNVGIDEFGPGDWYGTYKALGDTTSQANFHPLVCQVCWAEKRVEILPIDIVDASRGIMRVQERWIWVYDRETGTEHRAVTRGAVRSANDEPAPVAVAKPQMVGV